MMAKRPVGRPAHVAGERLVTVSSRISPAELKALIRIAEEMDRSFSNLLRFAVCCFLESPGSEEQYVRGARSV